MQENNPLQYYMVVDEKSTGPFSLEEILNHPALRPETLVWKPGIDNWVPARTLPEFSESFIKPSEQRENPEINPPRPEFHNNPYYHQDDYTRKEPFPPHDPYLNRDYGNQYGPDPYHNPYGQPNNGPNPYNNDYNNYNNDYNNPYYRGRGYQGRYGARFHTNWLPWAIVATILGLFCSCIGAIFGIVGIVQANKANTLYARNLYREADSANSNAKVMTIIGLCLAGVGILVALYFGNIFSFYY